MTHKLGELENPYIQVVWEDDSSNFSQERIKSIKEYFQKKYSSHKERMSVRLFQSSGLCRRELQRGRSGGPDHTQQDQQPPLFPLFPHHIFSSLLLLKKKKPSSHFSSISGRIKCRVWDDKSLSIYITNYSKSLLYTIFILVLSGSRENPARILRYTLRKSHQTFRNGRFLFATEKKSFL